MSFTPHPTAAASVPKYGGLNFSFADMEREVSNMRLLSKQFINRFSYETVIPLWQSQLSTFKSRPSGSKMYWEIPEDSPIETNVSDGKYEPAGRGGRKVLGRVSGKWEIIIPDEVRKKKGGVQKTFTLLGLASTRVTVWEHFNDKAPEEVARWTVEVGDIASPGCHFHTQITLEDANNKFPKFLSVPRLPTLILTPMDALEYLLSELFQDDWYQHASRESPALVHWSGCQRNRLEKLLGWHLEKIRDASGSPWTTFKRQKPPINMLIGNSVL